MLGTGAKNAPRRGSGALTGVLVALDGGGVAFKLNNLADELVPTDLDQLVHLGAGHVLSDDHYRQEKGLGEQAGEIRRRTYGGRRPCKCGRTWTRPFRNCLPCCFLCSDCLRLKLLLCLSDVNKSLTVSGGRRMNLSVNCEMELGVCNRPRLLNLIFYL